MEDLFLNSISWLAEDDESRHTKESVIYRELGYAGLKAGALYDEKTIEQAIYKNPTEIELKTLSKQQGMTTMQEDGVLKVLQGVPSIAEVERLTGEIEWLRT